MRQVLIKLLIPAGILAGCILSFFLTAFVCGLIDWAMGKSDDGGNNLMTVGWIFCLATVPIGGLLGGWVGSIFAGKLC